MSQQRDRPGRGRAAGRSPQKVLSREEFGSLFMANERSLWYVAAGVLGRPTHASDVLQEAAAVALGKLDQFDPSTSFPAWMGQVVRFVALNAARRLRTEGRWRVEADVVDGAVAMDGPRDVMPITATGQLGADQDGFDDRVAAALRGLDETARACLLLRVVGGRAYREIAEILSIPEGTAMSHVHRSRHAMRQSLSGEGVQGGTRR